MHGQVRSGNTKASPGNDAELQQLIVAKDIFLAPSSKVTVRNLKVSAGAGFIVALTGEIMTMPGLPKIPAAEKIDVTEDGRIIGLF